MEKSNNSSEALKEPSEGKNRARSEKTKKLALGALLIAICIISQFFKNMSVYITGPIINACLIIAVLTAGYAVSVIIAVVTPITSFIITGSPIMAAIPLIIPGVMLGNVILVTVVYLLKDKIKKPAGLSLSILLGGVLKALFMGIVISLIIIPLLLPEKMLPKMSVFQMTFSVTQLITALIGGVLAYVIYLPLKKAFSESL